MRPIVVVAALGTVLLASLAPNALAQADDVQGEQQRQAWVLEPRDVRVTTGREEFAFTSERESQLGHDILRGGFDMRSGVFTFVFEDLARPEVPLHRINLSFSAVIEFRDRNANGQFEPGDEIIQYIPIPNYEGRRVFAPDPLGGSPQRVQATYHLPLASVMTITFTIPERPVEQAGRLLRPTQTGIDIDVTNFPFRSNATELAIETRTETNADGLLRGGRASGLYFPAADRESFYRWHPFASVNDLPDAVGTTALEFHVPASASDTASFEDTVILAYRQGPTIEHGMEIGVRPATDTVADVLQAIPGDWRFFLLGVLLTVGVIGGAAYVKVRDGRSPRSVRES